MSAEISTSAAAVTLSGLLARHGAEMLQRVQRSLVQVVGRSPGGSPHGAGAGVIWRQDGIIITNHHVVAWENAKYEVLLSNGSTYPAQVLARHPEIDLAIVKIDARDLPVALVADSRDLHVGQLVYAVGHPWGQPGVVTGGIISALAKAQTRDGKEVPIIRSDALLAPGNSGGPLVNAAGGVLGINTMIIGGDQAVAIPSHLAQSFVEQAG